MFSHLKSVSSVVKEKNLFAKKSLGQNFLFDQNITDKIVRSTNLSENSNVIEIGPGPGALTRSIVSKLPNNFYVIEKDSRFLDTITDLKNIMSEHNKNMEIVNDDALTIDYNKIFEISQNKFQIIANLPYNIGTEIIFNFIKHYKYIDKITVMLQLEVVERIIASKNSKNYGRISVMLQSFFDCYKIFELSPTAFFPAPKVTSAIVQLIPKKEPLFSGDLNILSKVVQILFSERRKKIAKIIENKLNIKKEQFSTIGITGDERIEQISIPQIIKIAYTYINQQQDNL